MRMTQEIKGASLFEQVKFGIMHPYVAINRHDLKRVNFLARRWRSMGIEGGKLLFMIYPQ